MSHEPTVPTPAHSPLGADAFGQTPCPPRKTTAKGPRRFNLDVYRAAVWLVVAVLAVIVWFAGPSDETTETWASQISAADAKKIINDASTEGAPQQTVVNGWYVADVLPILSHQSSAVHSALTGGRLPSLGLLFGLGYCIDVIGCSLGRVRIQRRETETPPLGV